MRKTLSTMNARPFEHTVWTVPCRAGKGFFLYTNGADPEFLIEDVPAAYAQLCADALNPMVERTRSGIAPRGRQCQGDLSTRANAPGGADECKIRATILDTQSQSVTEVKSL